MRQLYECTWVFWMATVLAGCNRSVLEVHEVEPIEPAIGFPYRQISSLRPTFRWNPVAGPDVTYDLIVYPLGHPHPNAPGTLLSQDGRNLANTAQWRATRDPAVEPLAPRIYFRESLKRTSHVTTRNLESRMQYGWAVRIRRREDVGDWATFHASSHKSASLVNMTSSAGYVAALPLLAFFGQGNFDPTMGPAAQNAFRDASTDYHYQHHPFVFVTPKRPTRR